MARNPRRLDAIHAAIGAALLAATTAAATSMLRSGPDIAGAPIAAPAPRPLAEASALLANGDVEGARRAFDGAGPHPTIRIATAIHGGLSWSRDGSRLAFLSGGDLVIQKTGDFQEAARLDAAGVEQYALSEDGRLAALFRPEGKTVTEGVYQILRTDTGELLGEIPDATSCGRAMAFSPDGKLFVGSTGSFGDYCAHAVIWDVERRAVRHIVPPRAPDGQTAGRIEHVDLLLGGALLRTGEDSGPERTWDLATGALVGSREGFLDEGPDGIGLTMHRIEGSLHAMKLFDTRANKDLGELTDEACPASMGAIMGPKGAPLASFGDSFLCLWDPRARRFLGKAALDERPFLDDIRFTPNGEAVVVGRMVEPEQRIERARVYSAKNAAQIEDLGPIVYLGPTRDALLFLDSRAHELVRVRGARPAERTPFTGRRGKFLFPTRRGERSASLEPWAWSPRTDSVVADDSGLAILDGATGQLVQLVAEPGKWQVQTSPDLHWMVGWDDRGHSRIWDLVRRRAVRAMSKGPGVEIGQMEITTEELRASDWATELRLKLATGAMESKPLPPEPHVDSSKPSPLYVEVEAQGRTVRLHPVPNPTFVLGPAFDIPPGQSRVRLAVTATAVSPDERKAAVGFALGDGVVDNVWQGEVRVFELPSGRQTRRYHTPYWVYLLQFDDDGGRLLATGNNDPVGLWVWDLEAGKALLEIPGVNTTRAALTGRGDRVTFLGNDGLEAWDVARSKRVYGPVPRISDLAIAPDGDRVAALGGSAIRLLDASGALVRTVAAPANDRSTAAFFAGGVLVAFGGDAVELLRGADGARVMSLRLGATSALGLSGDKVELFGDEATARQFASCRADGFDFPLAWCERGHLEKGMLAKLLSSP